MKKYKYKYKHEYRLLHGLREDVGAKGRGFNTYKSPSIDRLSRLTPVFQGLPFSPFSPVKDKGGITIAIAITESRRAGELAVIEKEQKNKKAK